MVTGPLSDWSQGGKVTQREWAWVRREWMRGWKGCQEGDRGGWVREGYRGKGYWVSRMERSTRFNAMGNQGVDWSGHWKAVADLGEDGSVECEAA